MKSRGLASPDRADAVILAVAAKGAIDDMLMEYVRPSMSEVFKEASAGRDPLLEGMDIGY